jgi:hypothetical protein
MVEVRAKDPDGAEVTYAETSNSQPQTPASKLDDAVAGKSRKYSEQLLRLIKMQNKFIEIFYNNAHSALR